MDLKKVIVSGIPAGLVIYGVAYLLGAFTFQFAQDWGISAILKPLGDEFFLKGFVFYMAVGLILAGAFNIFGRAMPWTGVSKWLKLGITLWIISMIPGMGIVFFTLALPDKLIVTWLGTSFIEYMLASVVIGFIQERI
jgi:hypothetical protein